MSNAKAILDERLAKGEITVAEYEALSTKLGSSPLPARKARFSLNWEQILFIVIVPIALLTNPTEAQLKETISDAIRFELINMEPSNANEKSVKASCAVSMDNCVELFFRNTTYNYRNLYAFGYAGVFDKDNAAEISKCVGAFRYWWCSSFKWPE
nr:SHOCT domain-containing protein [uncultured Shinella sp.]